MKKLFIFCLLFVPITLHAQGVRKDDVAQVNIQGFVKVIPGALITVCPIGSAGIPCAPATTLIYSDVALTVLKANPFHADASGNYGWFSAPGNYTYTISGLGVLGRTFTATMPCIPGAGCTGTGSVTNVSSADADPLFVVSIANPTTVPAFSFTQKTAATNTLFGNNTGGAAAPSFLVPNCSLTNPTICGSDVLFKSGVPHFDVKAFGAKCDDPGNGSGTDDTANFNTDIVAMYAAFGGVTYVPRGAGGCKVAGASLVFTPGGATGSWSYLAFDNGLYLTSSLSPSATASKTAFVGRRGSAFGLSGSESNPSVNFITSGNFPGFTIGHPTTGTYLEGIGLVEKTGPNTACNFKITSDGTGGGPVQLELNHVMFLTTGTGGNVCASPLAAADSTGNSLHIHDSYLQTPTSATSTINLQNFQLVKVNNVFLRAGGITFGNTSTYAQCSGLTVSNILTESLTNTSLVKINALGSSCSNISVGNLELADNVGSVYLFQINSLGASQVVVKGGIRGGSFTALLDPASTALPVAKKIFVAEPGVAAIEAGKYQSGWVNSGDPMPSVYGRHPGSNWSLSNVTVRYTNIARQDPTAGGNPIYLGACTGCTAVAVTDPFGGNNAVHLATSSGSQQPAKIFNNATFTSLAAGDRVVVIVWMRSASGNGFINGGVHVNLGGANTFNDTGTAEITAQPTGDGSWYPIYTVGTVANGFASNNVSATISVDSTHPIDVYEPTLFRIPAAVATEEAYLFAMYATTWPTGASVGDTTPHLGFFPTLTTSNGARMIEGQSSELITLSTIGATTDSTANLLPANSVLLGVVARVTTTITTATDWELGDGTIAGRFSAPNATLVAGTTQVGTVMVDQTGTSGPIQTAAAKLRITTTGTPGAGIIRVTVYYRQFVPPTN